MDLDQETSKTGPNHSKFQLRELPAQDLPREAGLLQCVDAGRLASTTGISSQIVTAYLPNAIRIHLSISD